MAGRTLVTVPINEHGDIVEFPIEGTPVAPCYRGTADTNFAHDYTIIQMTEAYVNSTGYYIVCRRCGVSYQLSK